MDVDLSPTPKTTNRQRERERERDGSIARPDEGRPNDDFNFELGQKETTPSDLAINHIKHTSL